MVIQLKDIDYSYSSSEGNSVLSLQEWSVSGEEHVFIHGPSGCGKSTLLNIISGILQPQQGRVTVLGQSIDTMSSRRRDAFRANHLGYVFQQFNLIPYLNAIENIKLASYFSSHQIGHQQLHDDITNLLSALNIDESEHVRPARALSIGQQQRIAIARALINKPALLIVDEPTSSLDQDNRDNFMTLLMQQVTEHNITLVFVSHDISLASYFTRVDRLPDINQVVVR